MPTLAKSVARIDGWQFRAAQLEDAELLRIRTVVYSAVGNVDESVEALNVALDDPVRRKPVDVGGPLELVAERRAPAAAPTASEAAIRRLARNTPLRE